MSAEKIQTLFDSVRSVPDFPKPGILFRDITPILGRHDLMKLATDLQYDSVCEQLGGDARGTISRVVGIESRGFLFGMLLADRLQVGFTPVRKPGKLPAQTASQSYELEYGQDTLEIHTDGVEKGEKVLLVDDLLATGGTAAATIKLLEGLGAQVTCCCFLVELAALKGRDRLNQVPSVSVLRYA